MGTPTSRGEGPGRDRSCSSRPPPPNPRPRDSTKPEPTENARRTAREVGHDAVDPEREQRLHLPLVVDRPGVDLEAKPVGCRDALGGNELDVAEAGRDLQGNSRRVIPLEILRP